MMPEPTPLRPDEQVAGGFLVMSLGGTEHNVPVLPIRLNREWTKRFAGALHGIVDGVGKPKTLEDVAESISGQAETLMDMLIAYDHSNVLPDREWIDTHATDGEVYQAIQQVSAAAFPFGSNLLGLALMQSAQKVRNSLRSTSSSPPTTGGRPRKSKAA